MSETEDYAQTPEAHATSHQDGGSDEISLAGLAIDAHKTSHQDGGADEVNCTGLIGRVNYVDRGDPAAFDWQLANFTRDNAWHELDCSAIVPDGATAIHLRLTGEATAAEMNGILTKNGNTNTKNGLFIWIPTPNGTDEADSFVACDTNRKLQYRFAVGSWTWISIVIRGWLI